ncbi:hypothetical protein GCM10011384_34190 [Psychrobacillus lasiicapitis]|nr:hypothetical protein GCM10011384_34190 [Psychrobacillus lasiicapitis]
MGVSFWCFRKCLLIQFRPAKNKTLNDYSLKAIKSTSKATKLAREQPNRS